jgi:hypothetical protein
MYYFYMYDLNLCSTQYYTLTLYKNTLNKSEHLATSVFNIYINMKLHITGLLPTK